MNRLKMYFLIDLFYNKNHFRQTSKFIVREQVKIRLGIFQDLMKSKDAIFSSKQVAQNFKNCSPRFVFPAAENEIRKKTLTMVEKWDILKPLFLKMIGQLYK